MNELAPPRRAPIRRVSHVRIYAAGAAKLRRLSVVCQLRRDCQAREIIIRTPDRVPARRTTSGRASNPYTADVRRSAIRPAANREAIAGRRRAVRHARAIFSPIIYNPPSPSPLTILDASIRGNDANSRGRGGGEGREKEGRSFVNSPVDRRRSVPVARLVTPHSYFMRAKLQRREADAS